MKYDWNKDQLKENIKISKSYSEVLKRLDIPIQGNNISTLKRKILEYNLDISHFTFSNYSKNINKYISVTQYLTTNSNIKSSKLKSKLIKEGLKQNKCERCGIDNWMGEPIICQLHHINGNNRDNRIENLQMLCPNCHSQTDNYCGNANKKKHYYCKDCGKEINRKSKYCPICASKHRRKVTRPSKDYLIKQFKEIGTMLGIAKQYGVTDKTISKWCIYYGLPGKSAELKKLDLTQI